MVEVCLTARYSGVLYYLYWIISSVVSLSVYACHLVSWIHVDVPANYYYVALCYERLPCVGLDMNAIG